MEMPTLFLSHGSPMLALEEEPTTKFLRGLSQVVARPAAILVASAHWETDVPLITGSAHPETIHDFYGFPRDLYQLRYKAPGDADLAARIQKLLERRRIQSSVDDKRGLDHGAWDPLILMYPSADIPVLEISVQSGRNAGWHYRVGEALAPLKDENVLIIGSGNLTHNLSEAFRGRQQQTPAWVAAFAEWIADKVRDNDIQSLLEWERLAPYARRNHPTPEHFLPFFVALGAAKNTGSAQRLNKELSLGVLAMDAYLWNGEGH